MYHSYRQNRLEVGESHVTIISGSSSEPTIAKILHKDVDPDSGAITAIFLDRLVTDVHTKTLDGWTVSGAIATALRPAAW